MQHVVAFYADFRRAPSLCVPMLAAGPSSLIVSYDRLSAGWTGPARDGAYGPADTVFTMRVDVSNASL